MTTVRTTGLFCGFCPYLGIMWVFYINRSLWGYLPSLMAASARQRSHFFASSFSDMLNISLRQARSVKPDLMLLSLLWEKKPFIQLELYESKRKLDHSCSFWAARAWEISNHRQLHLLDAGDVCGDKTKYTHENGTSVFLTLHLNASLRSPNLARLHVAILR